MEQKALQDIFLKLLAAELNGTAMDETVTAALSADPTSFRALYDLSKKHDLAHIVASALQTAGVEMPAEIRSKFQKEEFLSVYRLEQLKYAYEQICATLEVAEIAYIPLKGSVLRPHYPRESMRTSCDIDILVREETLPAAVDALRSQGYVFEKREYHDVSLHSPEGVHLELHFSIQENMERLDPVLCRAWDHAVSAEGYRQEFTPDFLVFHQLAHMAHHFLSGGCGVRPLMDLWVMKHRMGLDLSVAHPLLDEAGLGAFAAEMINLTEVCFSGESGDDFAAVLRDYILNGGVYGNMENRVSLQTSEGENTLGYACKRLFLPYRHMAEIYPILKKVPVLLPFCWVARAFRALFSGKKMRRAVQELQTAESVSDAQRSVSEWIRERVEL